MSLPGLSHTLLIQIWILILAAGIATAQEEVPPLPATPEAPVISTATAPPDVTALAPVTVIGRPEDTLTGVNSFDRQILERLPARNDSINEAISIMPGVLLPEQGRSSLTAGEIIPPRLAISGGKTYQNNFLIDGIGNNSLLDPAGDDPTSITIVPGHPQALFLDASLVEEISVYRYNIPARYGHFSGGVVDVQTRTPGPDFFGELSYRTTRGAWTDFHIDHSIAEDFENSSRAAFQPDFEKHLGGLLLNIPVADNLSLLTSYQLTYSDIGLQHLGESRSQTRQNQNFLFKLAWDIDSRSDLQLSLQHAPYQGDYFYPDSKDSDFTIEGGGQVASLRYQRSLPLGLFSLDGAWKASDNNRSAPPDLRPWLISAEKPWGEELGTTSGSTPVSFEGSVGSIESSQQGFEVNLSLEEVIIQAGSVTHQIGMGFEFEREVGDFERKQPTSVYYKAVADDDVVCPPGVNDCIDGQQYFNKRLYFAADSISASINFWDVYLEDKLSWKNLELRPGIRVSYDDFMGNTNLAPRFSASYDLFGDRSSLLFGGLNRYYGATLLTYKLREASQPYQTELRDPDTLEWYPQPPFVLPSAGFVNDRRGRPFKYSELDSPYSDEIVLGISQRLLGGQLVLTWVNREGRDEFTRETVDVPTTLEDGTSYFKETYQLANRGKSTHDEYSLEWERAWQKHYISFNATYQETTTNNETYGSSVSIEDLADKVWYDGEFLYLDELPRSDFNRPWTINIIYSARLPCSITFTNTTRYQSGYEGLDLLNNSEKEGLGLPTSIRAYAKQQKPESWVFDWQFSWQKSLPHDQALTLMIEIDNVFDQKVETGDPSRTLTYETYQTGRQFWLGMNYSF